MSVYKQVLQLKNSVTGEAGTLPIQDSLNGMAEVVPLADGLAIKHGLVPGFTAKNVGGSTDVEGAEQTVGAGFTAGERIQLDRAGSGLRIASDNAVDNIAGIGARLVRVTYIDVNGDEQESAFMAMNGQTPVDILDDMAVPIVAQFVNQVFMFQAGSNETNVGTLYIGRDTDPFLLGRPTIGIWNSIGPTSGVSTTASYMIPTGFDSTCTAMTLSCDQADRNVELTVRQRARVNFGLGELQFAGFVVHLIGALSVATYAFPVFGAGTVIEFTAECDPTKSSFLTVLCQNHNIDLAISPGGGGPGP